MAKWARIENGKVLETTDLDPTGRFHSSLVWVACEKEVGHGWLHADGAFTEPPPPPPTTAQDLAPGRSLEGLSPDEVAAFEALADLINTNPDALRQATEV